MPRPQTVSHDRDGGSWEMASAAPHVSLRAHVRRYVGWFSHRTTPIYQRALPTHEVPVIISFGEPIRMFDVTDLSRSTELGSFANGAYDSSVLVEANGSQGGIQIDFTILGMRLFLNRPLGELTNRAVALDDIFGTSARRLTAQLHDAPTWEVRFDILDREIATRIDSARAPAGEVLCAWNRIIGSGGRVEIASIVEETGWSQKHLIGQFRQHIGLSPKAFARVMRFGRAINQLRRHGHARLAEVALDCGYYDQSHFDRDFKVFAGVTPTELLRSLTAQGGFVADR